MLVNVEEDSFNEKSSLEIASSIQEEEPIVLFDKSEQKEIMLDEESVSS